LRKIQETGTKKEEGDNDEEKWMVGSVRDDWSGDGPDCIRM
jgi:hypothetical protein